MRDYLTGEAINSIVFDSDRYSLRSIPSFSLLSISQLNYFLILDIMLELEWGTTDWCEASRFSVFQFVAAV